LAEKEKCQISIVASDISENIHRVIKQISHWLYIWRQNGLWKKRGIENRRHIHKNSKLGGKKFKTAKFYRV
jgi:hypothetical protein